MKRWIDSCIVAFSMYSRIPMPKRDWNEENMRYCMCFFPLVGLAVGLLELICYHLCAALNLLPALRAAILVLVPVLVTGGIHVDGLLDTADALSSHASREQKLEIMKDHHCGAFAVLTCVLYFLMMFGVFSQMSARKIGAAVFVFVISRSLSGYAAVTFEKARDSGLLKTFSDAAANYAVSRALIVELCVGVLFMVIFSGPFGVVAAVLELLLFWRYKKVSEKELGGITGDTEGFFVQMSELLMLFCLAVIR